MEARWPGKTSDWLCPGLQTYNIVVDRGKGPEMSMSLHEFTISILLTDARTDRRTDGQSLPMSHESVTKTDSGKGCILVLHALCCQCTVLHFNLVHVHTNM